MRSTFPLLASLSLLAWFVCFGEAGQDPYKTLGVDRSASAETIKKQFRTLARKYHPDKAGEKSQQKFIELQQAYETLSDPAKKREYDLGGSSSTYSRGGGGYGRQYSSYSGWGNSYSGFGQQRRTFYDTSFDDILPSETVLLTSTNMRQYMYYGGNPWLVQLYAEDSTACRSFSHVWEAVNKAMFSGTPDKPWVSLGRINWRHQRNLAAWLVNAQLSGGEVSFHQLPLVYGVPRNCMEPRCFVRYYGPLTLPGLQEFAAAKLLKLPPVPSVSLPTFDVLLQRVHPAKVVALAFSKSEGQGSIPLRQLALKHEQMMHFARVAVGGAAGSHKGDAKGGSTQEQQGAAASSIEEWSQRLGVQVSVPSLVLLRGPGTKPEVLAMKPGEVHGYEEAINARGLMWQAIPPLRPYTLEHLGVRWWDGRRQSMHARKVDPIKLCVVVVGRGKMEQARSNALRLSLLLAELSARESRVQRPAAADAASAASAALMASQLRVTWLEAGMQRTFCAHHFQDNGGTDSNSELVLQVCGSGGWGAALANAGRALLAQDFSAVLRALVTRDPPPRAALLAYVPTPTPSVRGKEAPLHMFSTFTELPSIGERPLSEDELVRIAAWTSQCVEQEERSRRSGWKEWLTGQQPKAKGPLQIMKSADGKLRYPPPLVDDDILNTLEFLHNKARMMWEPLQDLLGPMLYLVGPELKQLLGLFLTVGIILLLHQLTGRMQQQQQQQQQRE